MKKSVLVIVSAVIVIAGVAILALTLNHSKSKTSGKSTTMNNTAYMAVDACNALTSGIAGQILGSTAVKGTVPGGGESTDDIAFSECMYTAGPTVDPPHVVSLAVRSAKDSAGASSNKAVFTTAGKPAGAQDVTGYGSASYWDASMGQLNILKDNNWYIVSNYTGTSPTNGTATLTQAEQLAQALKL